MLRLGLVYFRLLMRKLLPVVVGSDLDFAQLAPQGRMAGLGLENHLVAVVVFGLVVEVTQLQVVVLNLLETMADEGFFSELNY